MFIATRLLLAIGLLTIFGGRAHPRDYLVDTDSSGSAFGLAQCWFGNLEGTAEGATPLGEGDALADDGALSLREAICLANHDGEGSTITLPAGETLVFGAADNASYGPNALPIVTSAITIFGQGATLERASGAPAFRFFYVSGAFHELGVGALTLVDLCASQYGNGAGGDITYIGTCDAQADGDVDNVAENAVDLELEGLDAAAWTAARRTSASSRTRARLARPAVSRSPASRTRTPSSSSTHDHARRRPGLQARFFLRLKTSSTNAGSRLHTHSAPRPRPSAMPTVASTSGGAPTAASPARESSSSAVSRAMCGRPWKRRSVNGTSGCSSRRAVNTTSTMDAGG